jgi:acyl phosphate:glycerol-3-phosphate acyltransferase
MGMPDGTMPLVYWPLMLVAAYLLGSVPFSQIVARVKGVDLRKVGSGNVGAGNLTANVGKTWGTAAALLDALKGLVPVYLARKVGLGPGAAGMVGLSAVIGHNWSIFMRGRSGRGLATSAGTVVALDPILMVWITGWAIAGWKIGGGLGGFLGWGLLPMVSVAMGRPPTQSVFLALLAAVIIWRRMQGNPDSPRDPAHMWRRALYDTDPSAPDFDTVEDPITP